MFLSRWRHSGAGLINRRWNAFRSAWHFGWLEAGFLVLVLLALAMRMWELEGRALHYDEAIHVHYAWRLSNLEEYIHSPWMHGPFQIEYTAIIFRLFGDTDFTARVGYVIFGAALVGLPYFLRNHLGRSGSLIISLMLTLSPTLLYFSRFGRNDVIMAFWAVSLLILFWRYLHESKNKYLYLSAAVLALMFTTKETAYLITVIFGGIAFLLALPELVPVLLRRDKFSQLRGAAGFLILAVTLTLPQWSAAVALVQGVLGLSLINADGVSAGLVGAPQWEAPFVGLPIYLGAWWLHGLASLLLAGLLAIYGWRRVGLSLRLFPEILAPLGLAEMTALLLFRPIGDGWDLVISGSALAVIVSVGIYSRYPWKRGTLLLIVPPILTLIYAVMFTGLLRVDALLGGLLPNGIQVDTTANGLPVNYLVAGGVLLVAGLVSLWLGMKWRGGVWLTCAAIFYSIWTVLYTTFFTNPAGIFSGVWQGMGYWIAQQEVARGNQPWYYYFVGLSVYELLPVLFGIAGALYFLKRGDPFGLVLAIWSGLTFLAYTTASEKMPWLLVNITLPLIFLSGKYLGELVERVSWRQALVRGHVLLLLLPPLAIAAGVYLLRFYVTPELAFSINEWGVLAAIGLLATASAWLIRAARPCSGAALAVLGVASLLLGFGAWTAVRAAYTFDDSNVEILVYAQGSADLAETFRSLDQDIFQSTDEREAVRVDYDLWYPFQWYVRHQAQEGVLQFSCFKKEGEDGWNEGCSPATGESDSQALLLTAAHERRDKRDLTEYEQEGPLRNLLWFPESYRRPGENRQAEKWPEELTLDLEYFQESLYSREAWQRILNYLLFRNLEREWYASEYYSYRR